MISNENRRNYFLGHTKNNYANLCDTYCKIPQKFYNFVQQTITVFVDLPCLNF